MASLNSYTVKKEPEFVQSVGNPIILQVSKKPYTIGQLFFAEIWVTPSKNILRSDNPKTGAVLLRTLTKNGPGNGDCSFDLSNALATEFRHDTLMVPDAYQFWQKDESAYTAYYIKAGFITYNAQNQQVKTYKYESGVKVAIRAWLPLNTSGSMMGFCYQFDGESVDYLTSIPDRVSRKRNEDTFLSFFLPINPDATGPKVHVKADLQFTVGSPAQGYVLQTEEVASGGLYLINVKPERLVAHPLYQEIVSYTVYLEYEDDDNAPQVMTQGREFRITESIPSPITLLFMNRRGGWDSIQFRRDTDTEVKTKVSTFTSGYRERAYQIETQSNTTYYSPWLTQDEARWLQDLKYSVAVYIDGRYQRPNDTTFKEDSSLGLTVINLQLSPDVEENMPKL